MAPWAVRVMQERRAGVRPAMPVKWQAVPQIAAHLSVATVVGRPISSHPVTCNLPPKIHYGV